jgi:hypothetical protein
MGIEILAEASANTQPGWGKLVALLIAVGVFWIGVQVHKRYKAVRDGREVNPFSLEEPAGTETEKTQVNTPLDLHSRPAWKGVGKWFRKG